MLLTTSLGHMFEVGYCDAKGKQGAEFYLYIVGCILALIGGGLGLSSIEALVGDQVRF